MMVCPVDQIHSCNVIKQNKVMFDVSHEETSIPGVDSDNPCLYFSGAECRQRVGRH